MVQKYICLKQIGYEQEYTLILNLHREIVSWSLAPRCKQEEGIVLVMFIMLAFRHNISLELHYEMETVTKQCPCKHIVLTLL